MDPLGQLQADLEYLHPLERARRRGERAEAAEARQAELERQARRDQAEAQLAQRAALDRVQQLERGYTDSELAHWQAGQDAAKREQVEKLEAELTRLDPARAQVRRAETARAARRAEDDRLLAAVRREDPWMDGLIARFRQRRAGRPFDGEVSRSASRFVPEPEYGPPQLCDGCGHLQCHCYVWRGGQIYEELQPGPCDPDSWARCTKCQSNGQARRSGTGWPGGGEITRVCSGDGLVYYGDIGEVSR